MPEELRKRIDALRAGIERAFVGEAQVIEHLLIGLFAGGHVLIEDVPGVGKTTLARALARSIDCGFRRLQFTPDMLPADILGVSLYDPSRAEFVFRAGPIFTNVLLADEVNRTPPRTQSALLEAMSEGQVSVDGKTRELRPPFMVLATMNPSDSHGTYELPESQLDRFFLRLSIGYPDREMERAILRSHKESQPVENLEPQMSGEEVLEIQALVRGVRLEASLEDYVMDIVRATRDHPEVIIGASPRACLALYRAAQASAFLGGRDYVVPDDVKALAAAVLGHRLLIRGREGDRASQAEIISEVLRRVEVPT